MPKVTITLNDGTVEEHEVTLIKTSQYKVKLMDPPMIKGGTWGMVAEYSTDELDNMHVEFE